MSDISLELATTEQIALELKKRCELFTLVTGKCLHGGQDIEIAMYTGGPRQAVVNVMNEAIEILRKQ